MLSENPKLKATDENGYEVYIENDSFYGKDTSKLILFLDGEWKIIQEPVPWQEAIQAWLDGKNVYYYFNSVKQYLSKDISYLEVLSVFGKRGLSKDELKVGKWYIED